MEYGSTKMEERSLAALVANWLCGLSIHGVAICLGNGALHLGDEPDPRCPCAGFESDLGSTAGKWLGALVGFYLWLWSGHC